MKKTLAVLLITLAPTLVFAKKGQPDTEGLYVVPSPPELVDHSRFIVQIVDPFQGPETTKISYIFPEVLIGEANRLIEFQRIEGTENSWTSDLLTAHCTVIDETYSCNISINKPKQQSFLEAFHNLFIPQALAQVLNLCQGQAVTHIGQMDLAPDDIAKYTQVVGQFCSNEPAGFLSYDFQ